MSRSRRGVRDGSGPFKDSYQRKKSKIGRRRKAGIPCPKKKK